MILDDSRDDPVAGPTGVIGAYDGHSQVVKILIVVFAGLTIYNALELFILIFMSFKKRKGLYFWGLLVSSIGLVSYALGFSFKLLGSWAGRAKWIGLAFLTIGWYAMVTGQSVVLWSRLNLIVCGDRGRRILKYTKWMIIVDAIILHVSTSVVTFGSNGDVATVGFVRVYNVIEKFQMTGFCIQEAILSVIYIVETSAVLRTSLRPETRSIMRQLVFINVAIILMDVALLSIEYASLFLYETMLKGFVYSVKLKIEFAILNRLVKFVRGGREEQLVRAPSMAFAFSGSTGQAGQAPTVISDLSDFVDTSKDKSKYPHAAGPHHASIDRPPGELKDKIWEIEGV